MSDTLDGMTVEQLDDLIKRAEVTKRRVESRDYIELPDYEGYRIRVGVNSKEVQFFGKISGKWERYQSISDAVADALKPLWSKREATVVANALIALSKQQ